VSRRLTTKTATQIEIEEDNMSEIENIQEQSIPSPENQVIQAEVARAVAEAKNEQAAAIERLARANEQLADAMARVLELQERLESGQSGGTVAQTIAREAAKSTEESEQKTRYEEWTGIVPEAKTVFPGDAETAKDMNDYMNREASEGQKNPLDEVADKVHGDKPNTEAEEVANLIHKYHPEVDVSGPTNTEASEENNESEGQEDSSAEQSEDSIEQRQERIDSIKADLEAKGVEAERPAEVQEDRKNEQDSESQGIENPAEELRDIEAPDAYMEEDDGWDKQGQNETVTPKPEKPGKPDKKDNQETKETEDSSEEKSISPEMAEKLKVLDEKRQKYVEMLKAKQLKRWWKRPSKDEQKRIWDEYKGVFNHVCLDLALEKIEGLEQGSAEWNEKFLEHIISMKTEELRKMSAISAEIATEDGKFEKIKKWWQSHKKTRLLIGLGLMGVGFATGPLGAGAGVALALAVTKGAFSGFGGFMATEAGMDMAQDKIEDRRGYTQLFSKEEIQSMGLKRVNKGMAAQLAKAIEQGKDATIDSKIAELWASFEERYEQSQREEAELLATEGKNVSEIASIMLDERLDEENRARVSDSEHRGNVALFKRVTSILAGTAIGAVTFGFASSFIHGPSGGHEIEYVPAPTGPEGTGEALGNFGHLTKLKPSGESLRHFANRMVNLIESQNGQNFSGAEHRKIVRGLVDMWQGPSDIPGSGVMINKSIRLTATSDMIRAALAR